MGETGGIIYSMLFSSPSEMCIEVFDTVIDIYSCQYGELRSTINDLVLAEKSDNDDYAVAAKEIEHLVGIFKKFFDKWYENEEFKQTNYILTRLATVFCDEDAFIGEYNKVCYLIRQNTSAAIAF